MARDHFTAAFDAMSEHEGRAQWSNRSDDPGGETYWGISRVWFPSAAIWPHVDDWSAGRISATIRDSLCEQPVRQLYRRHFWDRFLGDQVAAESPAVAAELLEAGVNLGVHRAVSFLQEALNLQNRRGQVYPDLVVDGRLGQRTLNTLRRYLQTQPGSREANEKILLNCMNGEQYIAYKNNPLAELNRGWFARV